MEIQLFRYMMMEIMMAQSLATLEVSLHRSASSHTDHPVCGSCRRGRRPVRRTHSVADAV